MEFSSTSACLFGKRENNSKRAFIEITNLCNMYCQHCMNNSGEQMREGLNKEEMLDLIGELRDYQISHLYISGGEPLLYKGIDEVLELAYMKGMKVTLATNGLEVDKHLSAIKKYVDTVSLSLDGIGDTHDSFRGVQGAYDKLIRVLDLLEEEQVKTRISSIIWKQNVEQLEEIVKLVKSKNIMKINFNILVPVGRAEVNSKIHIPVLQYPDIYKKMNELIEKYTSDSFQVDIKRRHRLDEKSEGCPGGKIMFHINAYGKVSPCSWLAKSDLQEDFSMYWKKGNLGKCMEACAKIECILENRLKKYGYAGCPALAYIYNGSFMSVDPLNDLI